MSYKINEGKNFLKQLLTLDLQNRKNQLENTDPLTPMLWGSFGVAKTAIVKQVATEMGFELIILRLNTLTPVDVRGLPHIEDVEITMIMPDGTSKTTTGSQAKFVEPSFVPKDHTKNWLIFFDEVNTAPPLCQSVAYEIAHERTMAGHKLPNGTCVVLVGNRAKDRGVTFDMPMPLANRVVHIEIIPDFDSFIQNHQRIDKKLHEDIFAYLVQNKTKVHMDLIEGFTVEEIPAVPSLRMWEMLSDFINHNPDYSQRNVGSFVGNRIATEFNEYQTYKSKLPDLNKVLIEGKKWKNEKLQLQYYFIVCLFYRLEEMFDVEEKGKAIDIKNENFMKNYINAVYYCSNEERELVAFALTLIKHSKKSLNYFNCMKDNGLMDMFHTIREILDIK